MMAKYTYLQFFSPMSFKVVAETISAQTFHSMDLCERNSIEPKLWGMASNSFPFMRSCLIIFFHDNLLKLIKQCCWRKRFNVQNTNIFRNKYIRIRAFETAKFITKFEFLKVLKNKTIEMSRTVTANFEMVCKIEFTCGINGVLYLMKSWTTKKTTVKKL